MRTWILHIMLLVLVMALPLAGCGAASTSTDHPTGGPSPGQNTPTITPTPISTPGPLPDDIPVYNGAQLLVAQYITTGTLYFYRVTAQPQEVSDFYLSRMPAQGWVQKSAEQNGDQGIYLVYTKGARSVTMNIVSDPMIAADTDISIILSNS